MENHVADEADKTAIIQMTVDIVSSYVAQNKLSVLVRSGQGPRIAVDAQDRSRNVAAGLAHKTLCRAPSTHRRQTGKIRSRRSSPAVPSEYIWLPAADRSEPPAAFLRGDGAD